MNRPPVIDWRAVLLLELVCHLSCIPSIIFARSAMKLDPHLTHSNSGFELGVHRDLRVEHLRDGATGFGVVRRRLEGPLSSSTSDVVTRTVSSCGEGGGEGCWPEIGGIAPSVSAQTRRTRR